MTRLAPALVLLGVLSAQANAPFSVAHRGASAYAPEHTADAYALAIAQGADYVEQDLCITRDGILVVSHDPSLERTTDIEELFPDRATVVQTDGAPVKRWFVEDFTLAELKRLDHGSWFDPKFAKSRLLTFQEAIDLVKGKAGLFPELKTPGRVRAKGFDMERAVADVLAKNGLTKAVHKGRPAVQLQVFEEDSLRRLTALLPGVPRTYLVGTAEGAARWLSAGGLDEVKTFATGIGPAKALIEADPAIVTRAHAKGLTVVPYTFLAHGNADRNALVAEMKKFVGTYKVDGLFTDNPDLFPR